MKRVWGQQRKVEPNSPIVEPEFVRQIRPDYICVREAPAQGFTREPVIEAG